MIKVMRLIGILLLFISVAALGKNIKIPADHAGITVIGRTTEKVDPLVFAHAGIQIKFNFKGEQLGIMLDDISDGSAEHLNFYNVYVNDSLVQVIEVHGFDTYEINYPFNNREVEIIIFKRTEAMCASGSFSGLSVNAEAIITKTKLNTRKIEWIGDSFTAGYGNLISTPPPPSGNPNTGFHAINQDNSKAWGAIASKQLNAEYMCTAFSGRGIYRNYDNSEAGTLPQMYAYVSPDSQIEKWDFTKFKSDLIVINLGQNDFGPETYGSVKMTDSTRFSNAYLDLLEMVKSNNPQAKILITIGGGLSDYFPTGFKRLTRSRTWIKAIAKQFNSKYPNSCKTFELQTIQPPYGEDWHPTVKSHNKMAKEAVVAIKKYMNW